MQTQPAKDGEKRLKNPPPYGAIVLWGTSLLLWLGLFQFPWPARLALAYGSFLLWSLSSGFIWGRTAPFLAVGFFLGGSWLLQKPDHQGVEAFAWLSLEHGLSTLLVFFSSLCSTIWMQARTASQQAMQRQKEFRSALLHVARMSSLGRMTTSVCHEMKNQIAVTIGYLEQIKDDEQLSDSHKRKIDRSLQANDKILKILTQLRMFARDTLNDPLQPVSLNLVILDSINFMDRHLLFHGITMELALGNNLPPVQGDAVQLQTIFINLLNQSIENFKGQKNPAHQSKHIRITSEIDKNHIRIHYSDNALRPETIGEEQYFDLAFHLGHQKLMHGLDLLIVHDLVLRQGGKIVMHQSEQEGAVARIHLPQAALPPQELPQEPEAILSASGL